MKMKKYGAMTILEEGLAQGQRLNRYELEQLATYNSEMLRGIMHTPEWQKYMADLQARFEMVDPITQ